MLHLLPGPPLTRLATQEGREVLQGALLEGESSSPGTEVSGLGAWAFWAGREVGRIGWALASSQFPGQRRSPVLASGGSDGLGPGSGVDLAKVKSHHLFSLGLSLPIFPGAAQLGMPRA